MMQNHFFSNKNILGFPHLAFFTIFILIRLESLNSTNLGELFLPDSLESSEFSQIPSPIDYPNFNFYKSDYSKTYTVLRIIDDDTIEIFVDWK